MKGDIKTMITFTTIKKETIDEDEILAAIKDKIFEYEVNDYDIILDLPIDTQRFIFAKIGAMLIDFSKDKDFGY